jgi:hypothetical protein
VNGGRRDAKELEPRAILPTAALISWVTGCDRTAPTGPAPEPDSAGVGGGAAHVQDAIGLRVTIWRALGNTMRYRLISTGTREARMSVLRTNLKS